MSLLFDLLPVELLFEIFSYLPTLDVIRAFSYLSPYTTQCICNYDHFNVNFQSIRKVDLDRICSLIQPHQIISLILSDDDHTPGQIGFFLSRVSIDQFVRLRVLRLIRADNFAAWRSIPTYLSKLTQLQSIYLDFDNIRPDMYDESHSNLDYIFRARTVTSLFLTNGRQSDVDFASLPIAPHLHRFRAQLWGLDDLPIMLSRVPNIDALQLEIQSKTLHDSRCLSLETTTCQFVRRLSVKFKFGISLQQMKQFLESFQHRLIFLSVEIDNWPTKSEVIDADWWKALIIRCFPKLKIFQLRVRLSSSEMRNIEEILKKFREPFWLYEKCWLFTSDVAYLCSTSLEQSTQTLSITIPWESNRPYRFSNVNRIELYSSYDTRQYIGLAELVCIQQKFIDNFYQLEHLHCGTTYVRSEFLIELLRVAPRLISLSIFDHERLNDILPAENDAIQYTQISRLKIERDLNNINIERICQTFPNLEYVNIQMQKSATNSVNKLICRLKYLSSLIFVISDGRFIDRNDRWTSLDPRPSSWQLGYISDWLRSNTNLSDYTYALDGEKIRLWIG